MSFPVETYVPRGKRIVCVCMISLGTFKGPHGKRSPVCVDRTAGTVLMKQSSDMTDI